ncbi:hypothetical protein F4861DRAFT_6134 [Xylaria intraflava]|nr:hypothetical protein F4861DRAFT_6134 [Xylaria intraflava]
MSVFPQCTRLQQGYPCSCPACMGSMLVDSMELNPGHQQLHASHAGPLAYQTYTGNVSENLLDADNSRPSDNFGGPVTPMSNQLPSDRSQDNTNHQGFSAINIGHREDSYNSFGEGFGEVQQPHTPDEAERLYQPGDKGPATLSSALDQQAKARPKRKSKYNDDPPQSIYGPPFVTKEISARMSEDEIRRRVEYNAEVSEARKTFMRHKNNMAAKKSRERKQALIDELTGETQRLKQRLKHAEAANRELLESVARVHAVESENAKLRRENDLLRARLGELMRKQEDLGAMFSLSQSQPQPQSQAPKTGDPKTPMNQATATQNPEQHHERNEEDQTNRDKAAEMNNDIDQFLSELDNGGNEAFNWDGYR